MYENVFALVLSSRRSGETDKRLVLYTRESGKLWALAVGAARPGARLAAATESPVEAHYRLWRDPRATVSRVTGGAVENGFPSIRRRWDLLSAAQFLCEWTERLTPPAEAHAETYDLLRRALSLLETEDAAAVGLAFQSRFLALSGYNPSRDVTGLSSVPGAAALLDGWAAAGLEAAPALPAGFPAAYLRQQLLKFVAPLLQGPLRAVAQEDRLRAFREKTLR